MASRPLVMTIAIAILGLLLFMMLFTFIQYAISAGFHNLFESVSATAVLTTAFLVNMLVFATAFVIMVGLLALLTHGAMIKAAKKFVAAYVAFGVILFVTMGIAGVMIALILTLISLMLLWQFALKNVVFRAPVAGPEENTGSEGTVVDTIDDGEKGRVRLGDTLWWAVSSDGSIIEKGERVQVDSTSSDKLTLKVHGIKTARKGPQQRCPYCGASAPSEADFCPNCGRSLQ